MSPEAYSSALAALVASGLTVCAAVVFAALVQRNAYRRGFEDGSNRGFMKGRRTERAEWENLDRPIR